MQSEQTNEIAAALAKAQGQMSNATFNKINPHFKNRYADLSAIITAVRKPLSDNGISITQVTELDPVNFMLVTTLHHTSGQWIKSEYPLPTNVTPQQLGSALTYAKRYSLSSIACISADEDDDAETAGNKHVTKAKEIVAEVQYNDLGEPIDNIPLGDNRIEALPKSKAKADYAAAQQELYKLATLAEMMAWGNANANRIASFPKDWQEMFRGQYAEHRQKIREEENAMQGS